MLPRTTPLRRPVGPALSTLALALISLTATSAAAAGVPTADELLDRSTKALGGRAIEKIDTYMAAADMVVPMGTMTSVIQWGRGAKDKPARIIAKQGMAQMGETVMGTDGEIAWTHNPMMGGYAILEGRQRDDIAEQAVHMSFMDLRGTSKGQFDFTDVTEVEFDGVECHELAFKGKDRDQPEDGSVFFDAESGLIRGMRVDNAGQPVTLVVGDWKEIDGVKFFHKMTITGGPMPITVTYKKIEVNKVDPAVFEVPAEVRELAKKQSGKTGEEMDLEDFSQQAQAMVKGMMEGLPWDDPEALKKARASIARQADSVPGEFGKGLKYVLKKIDAALAEAGG